MSSHALITGIAALFLTTGLVGCSHPLRLDLDGFTSPSKQDGCIMRGGSPKADTIPIIPIVPKRCRNNSATTGEA